MLKESPVTESPLGKRTKYVETYSPGLLHPIPRKMARDLIGMESLPFDGVDIWNGYELSWLNPKGKPEIAFTRFSFPCTTPHVVESKSLKLYLNSFNLSAFESKEAVAKTIEKDLSQAAGGPVTVELYLPSSVSEEVTGFPGICLDGLDIETSTYQVNPKFLKTKPERVEETVYSQLLKSNCLATGQPDWGSVYVRYAGDKIDHAGLLKYIISYRNHSGFGEHCVEQMFYDLLKECRPERLSLYAHFTRRGGLDINPFRSNFERQPPHVCALRQ